MRSDASDPDTIEELEARQARHRRLTAPEGEKSFDEVLTNARGESAESDEDPSDESPEDSDASEIRKQQRSGRIILMP